MKITFKNIAVVTSLCSALVLAPASFAGHNGGNYQGDNGYHQMSEKKLAKLSRKSVSYTHLTLPTNREV